MAQRKRQLDLPFGGVVTEIAPEVGGSVTHEALRRNHEWRMDMLYQKIQEALGRGDTRAAEGYSAQIEALQATLVSLGIAFEPRVGQVTAMTDPRSR